MAKSMMKKAISPEPGLYVTATPIGNLGDITYRAVATLKAADLILCEDTRQTAKLCAAYGIETPRSPYHDHNAAKVRPEIIKKLQDGKIICLVSDAGTPLISDPGYKLVRAARDEGIPVVPLPGASAAITALCAAGAPSDQFHFAGFVPSKQGARAKMLEPLCEVNATLIFYESAPRLSASLSSMSDVLGDRPAVVARELTKMHEEFREDTLSSLSQFYADNPTKGEIVIIVFPPSPKEITDSDIDDFLRAALTRGSVKEAATDAAHTLNIPRKDAYTRALAIKNKDKA